LSYEKTTYFPEFSQEQIDALARCFLPAIQQFFESGDGKREFAEWQAVQATQERDVA
jgi:hypothetical protein